MDHASLLIALKGSVLVLFVITAAGVVPCGGPNMSTPYIIHNADYIFILVF